MADPKISRASLRIENLAAALEQGLDNEPAVLDVLAGALAKGHPNPELWAKLHEAAAREDRFSDLAFAYEKLCADRRFTLFPPAAQVEVLMHAAAFFADTFGDVMGARTYLERVMAMAPGRADAFTRLEAVLHEARESIKLADLYATAAAHRADRAEQIALLRKAEKILDAFPDEEDRLIKVLQQHLKIDPADHAARKALEDRLARAGRLGEVAKMLEHSLTADPPLPDAEALAIRARLITLYSGELKEIERSVPHVEEVLTRDPMNAAVVAVAEALLGRKAVAARAVAALELPYERAGRIKDAQKMMALQIEAQRGPKRVEVQKRLADLLFHKAGDLAGAFAVCEQIIALEPGEDRVRERYLSLAASLDKRLDATKSLGRASTTARDKATRARIGVELGELYLELGDPRKARTSFQQVLDAAADDGASLRAARALAGLFEKENDARGLAAMLGRLADLTPDVEERERAAERLAQLCEGELKDPAGAIGAYRRLLGTGREAGALEALTRCYEETSAHADLAEILERRAALAIARDRVGARELYLRAAELRTTKLGDRAAAIASWRGMLEAFGPSRDVYASLTPLLEQERRWEDLASALDVDASLASGAERASVLARLGAIRSARLHDPTGALQAYRQALAIDPSEKTSRLAVERMLGADPGATSRSSQAPPPPDSLRLAACSVLEPIARAESAAQLLVRVLEVKAELAGEGAPPAIDAGESVSDMPSWGDGGEQPPSPGSSGVHDAVTKPPPASWDWATVADGTQPAAPRTPPPPADLTNLAADTAQPETRRAPLRPEIIAARLAALEEAAGLAERDLNDLKKAITLAARALALAASGAPDQIARWTAEVERLTASPKEAPRRAAALSAALGERPVESPELSHLAQRAGEALAAGGDVAGALALYRRALAFEPSSSELIGRVDELLAEQGSPEERVTLYREALSRPCTPARRRDLLHGIAAVQRRDLGDLAAAAVTYRTALQEDPDDVTAYEALLDTLAEAGAWDALYNELSGRLARVPDDERVNHELRMADVAARAGRPDVAAARYKTMLARGAPLGAEALGAIEALAREMSDAALIRQVLERRIAVAEDPAEEMLALTRLGDYLAEPSPSGDARDAAASAEARRRAAGLAEGPLGDTDRAVRLYELVLAALPADRHAAARLLSHYRDRGAWDQVPAVCEVLLDTSPSAPEALAELAVLEEAAIRAGLIDRFLAAADQVRERFPDLAPEQRRTVDAAVARALGADPARQDEAAAAHRRLVATAPDGDLTDLDAFRAFLAASPDTQARREDQRWLFSVLVERAPEGARVEPLAAWAAWEETEMDDQARAAALWERVLALDPDHDSALGSRARLLLSLGDYEGAAAVVAARRDRAQGEARAALEIELAALLFDRLNRPLDALEAVASALRDGAQDPAAREIAMRALAIPEARDRAAELLERAEAATEDTAARIELLETMLARGPEDPAARRRWYERLLDLHDEDPERALAVALRAAAALPGEIGLWERAEQIARRAKDQSTSGAAPGQAGLRPGPRKVIDAYEAVLTAGPALPPEDIEELGRRAVEYHEEWFDEPETTVRLLRRLVELVPGSTWGMERLKLAYNAAERWDDLFALYDAMLERAADNDERLYLLEDAATVARDLAADAERTMRYLEALLEIQDDARTRTSLERLYERHNRHRPLIKLLGSDLPRLAADAAQRMRERIALLWIDGVGEAEAALPVVEQMLDHDASSREAFDLLERILDATAPLEQTPERAEARRRAAALLTRRYRAEERHADLTRVLEIQADGAPDGARRGLLAEIVRLRRDVLGDEPGALDRLAALCVLAPAEDGPRAELAELCARLQRHDRHAEVLAAAADHAGEPVLAITLLQEAAAIRRDRLDDSDGAIGLLRRLFALAEQHARPAEGLAALRELDRLLGAAGRVVERCDVLDLLAERESAEARRDALGELARLSWSVLRDDERAIAAYRARLATDAADLDALDGLVGILERAGRHRELAAALDQRAAVRGGEPARRDLARVAWLFERELGEPDQAIATWLRVRSELGADVESGEALAALYAAAGRWAELVALLSVEAESAREAPDLARAAALSCRLGDAHRDHTLDWEQGVAAYRAAWDAAREGGAEAHTHAQAARSGLLALLERVDPAKGEHRSALALATAALLDIAAAEDDWRGRVALLEPRLAAAPGGAERVQILRESAGLLEERGGDVAGAFDLVWRAFLLAPGPERPADLLRLADAAGRWEVIAAALPSLEERGDVPAATLRDLWRRVAAWQRDEREDADAAERAFERALSHEAGSSAILFELAELQRRRPRAALVGTLLRLADASGGDLDLYREAVEVARDAAGDPARAREIAARLLDLAAERWEAAEPSAKGGDEESLPHPASAALWAIDALIDLLRGAGERAEVVALGRRGVAMPFPRDTQRRLLRAAADAAELDEAITLYAELFDEDPSNEPIGERLAALLAEAGRREALVRHRERQVEVCEDPARRVELRFEAAGLLAEGGEVIPAIEALRKNLEELPGHAPSAEKLAALLEEGGRHGDLTRLYEDQAALREAAGDPAAASLWLKAAELAERELSDPDRAIASHRRAAALGSAAAVSALDALARLLLARGEPAAAAEALERLCAVTPAGELHVEALRLAEAYVSAGRADRARAALERALGRGEPGSAGPRPGPRVVATEQAPLRERLRTLYREAGEWVLLAELIAEDAGRVDDPAARLALLRDAAELHLLRGGSPAAAIPLLEEAITLAPEDLGLRLSRCRALGAAGREADATIALRAMIAEFGARRPKERALVHYELARVALSGGDRATASAELDLALRIDPAHPGALQLAAGLALEDGQLERASRSYRALLLVARRPKPSADAAVSRAEILVALADIARRQGEPEREVEQMESAFEAARESELDHQRLLVALRDRARHDLLARGIESRLAAPPPEAERVALLEELAALCEGPLERPEAALDARLRALELRPESAAAHAAALELARRLEQLPRYVEAVERQLARHPGTPELLLHLGRALELAGDGAGAADAYRRAEAGLSPGDPRLPSVWSAILGIAERLGDREAMAGVLERRIAAADAADDERAAPELRAEPRYRLAALLSASVTTAERVADLLEQALALLPDPDRAEAALREALRQDPRLERAARLLERVARDADRPRTLIDALVLLADVEEPERAAEGLKEAAQLARATGDRALAETILNRMIDERAPGAAGAESAAWALCALADVREEAGDLAAAADLRERAARASSPEDERALLLRVASLAAGALDDLPRAARIYEELRGREPAEREIWEPLAEVYRRSGDAPRLNALLEETVPLVDTVAERCRLRLERARLLATGDAEAAIELLRDILGEDASQIEAAILLASMLEAAGRADELRDLFALQLDAAKDRGDVPSILSLSMRLGSLMEQGGDEVGALDVYTAAADWDGSSRDVLRAIVRLTQRRDDPPALGDALERLLKVERGEEAVAVALQLSELRAAQGDEQAAEEALELGYAACPSDDRLREELAGRYTAREAWHKLADLYVREAEQGTDEAKVECLCRAADILQQRAEDAGAAADALERALRIAPSDRDVLIAFIDVARAVSQHGRAAEVVSRAVEATPEDPWLYQARAELHDAQGEDAQALADRERAYELGGRPYAADLVAQLEKNLARADAEPEAEPDAEGGIVPRRARDLRLRLAEVLARSGELDRARDHLTELLRKDGKDRHALRTLASIEQSAERWDAAGAVYRRLIALEDGEALVATALKLADACERAERPGEARGGLERALRAAPDNAEVRERLRRIYESIGAHREVAAMVLEDARGAADVGGRFALLLKAARLLIDGDDAGGAMAALEEARGLRPDDQEASLLLAEAMASSGQRQEARALIAELIAAHKNRRSKQLGAVYQKLARIELLEGKQHDALAALSRAFENDPQNGSLAMELASFATERGEVEIAARAYRAVTVMKPAQEGSADGASPPMRALAYYHLAAMALAIGDRRKAKMMVDKALSEDAALEPAKALAEELKGG